MYVNTYIIPVPEQQKSAYQHIAEVFIAVARDFGAVQAFENWELEVPDGTKQITAELCWPSQTKR
jgi:uncharacterized protein YbaA (DUF1428 family)